MDDLRKQPFESLGTYIKRMVDGGYSMPKVVCAAGLIPDEKSNIIICSPRHLDAACRDTLRSIYGALDKAKSHTMIQGFVDQFGSFLTREEAYYLQYGRATPKGSDKLGKLFSEDLY